MMVPLIIVLSITVVAAAQSEAANRPSQRSQTGWLRALCR